MNGMNTCWHNESISDKTNMIDMKKKNKNKTFVAWVTPDRATIILKTQEAPMRESIQALNPIEDVAIQLIPSSA